MKRTDIDTLYTRTIADLISQGYIFDTSRVAGHQGEIAKVDLTNHSETLRVLLDTDYEGSLDYIVLTVGRVPNANGTIWNDRLEVRFQIRLAEVGRGWYLPEAEAKAAREKRRARYAAKHSHSELTALGEAYKSTALRYLRKQPKMHSLRAADLGHMWKVEGNGRRHFEIEVRDRLVRIG